MVQINGRVAWVSGAAQGIGLASTIQLVARGAKVVMVDICSDAQGQKAVEVVNKAAGASGGKAVFFRADVTDTAQVSHLEPRHIKSVVACIVCSTKDERFAWPHACQSVCLSDTIKQTAILSRILPGAAQIVAHGQRSRHCARVYVSCNLREHEGQGM
jgi:UDP-glucose 4-epimerase